MREIARAVRIGAGSVLKARLSPDEFPCVPRDCAPRGRELAGTGAHGSFGPLPPYPQFPAPQPPARVRRMCADLRARRCKSPSTPCTTCSRRRVCAERGLSGAVGPGHRVVWVLWGAVCASDVRAVVEARGRQGDREAPRTILCTPPAAAQHTPQCRLHNPFRQALRGCGTSIRGSNGCTRAVLYQRDAFFFL